MASFSGHGIGWFMFVRKSEGDGRVIDSISFCHDKSVVTDILVRVKYFSPEKFVKQLIATIAARVMNGPASAA